jgi:hypothetical protein
LGNAVFPIDYIPGLFLILVATASVSSIKLIVSDNYFVILFGGTLVGIMLMVATRLGVEGRNAAFLYPIALTLMVLAVSRSASWIRQPAMAGLVLLQTISVVNFVSHTDTAKGSYNTPFARTMLVISSLTTKCPGNTYVFTHDPVLAYLVEEAGGRVSSPDVPTEASELFLHEKDCVLIVYTYRGVLPPALYERFTRPLNLEQFRRTQILNFGYDRFHTTKAWVGIEPFPEYYITIEAYEALRGTAMLDWYHIKLSVAD